MGIRNLQASYFYVLGELVGKGVWLEEHEDGASSLVVQCFSGQTVRGKGSELLWCGCD